MQTTNLTKLKWKLTPEKKQEIVERYCKGEKPTFIAREIEIDHSTVYYYLKKANVFYSANSRTAQVTQKVITVVENNEVHQSKTTTVRFEEEPICEGHDYEYYLRKDKERRLTRSSVL